MENTKRPALFYFLMALLAVGVTFIGYKFAGGIGAIIAFILTCVVNGYAITIKND